MNFLLAACALDVVRSMEGGDFVSDDALLPSRPQVLLESTDATLLGELFADAGWRASPDPPMAPIQGRDTWRRLGEPGEGQSAFQGSEEGIAVLHLHWLRIHGVNRERAPGTHVGPTPGLRTHRGTARGGQPPGGPPHIRLVWRLLSPDRMPLGASPHAIGASRVLLVHSPSASAPKSGGHSFG